MNRIRFVHIIPLLLVCLLCAQNLRAQDAGVEEVKEQANELFQAGKYAEAKGLYSQLLSLYAKDPTYNYRFGACLLLADRDKEAPFEYIRFALGRSTVDPEAHYFLGLAYHMRYEFNKAASAYNEFKAKAHPKLQAKYEVDNKLRQCVNGKYLLRDITDLLVLNKTSVARDNYFRSYDLANYGGKLIAKPADFEQPGDKKSNDVDVLFLDRASDTLYFASYGKKTETGKDIYFVVKGLTGEYGDPQRLGGPVNTQYDEDYPFMSADKRTLYFASTGHNSMGGYDIFRTVLDPATGKWSEPKNLDYAVNTPDDDFMYVTDGKSAFFSSNRENTSDAVTIYKVRTERVPLDISVIKGSFKSEKGTKATITVRDLETGEEVGVFETDPATGEYNIPITKGGRYQFVIEPDQDTALYENEVRIPKFSGVKRWGQEITLDDTAEGGRLTINADFSTELPADPEDMLLASEILRKKASLEVNYSEAEAALADAETPEATPAEPDAIADATGPDAPPDNDGLMPWERDSLNRLNGTDTILDIERDITNKDIIRVANEDAEELQKEADELAIQSKVAYSLAADKNEQALLQSNEADEALQEAGLIADEAEAAEASEVALKLKKDARKLDNEAIIAYNLAKTVERKAEARQIEADRAAQYATDIKEAINTSNPERSIELLSELQANLENKDGTGDVGSELAQLKRRTDTKRTEAEDQAAFAQSLKNEARLRTTELNSIDTRLENTRDASERATLEQQKSELQAEVTDLNEQYDNEIGKARDLNIELAELEQEGALLSNVVDFIEETARIRKEEVTDVSDTDKERLTQEFAGKEIDIEAEVEEAVEVAMSSLGSDATAAAAGTSSTPSSGSETATNTNPSGSTDTGTGTSDPDGASNTDPLATTGSNPAGTTGSDPATTTGSNPATSAGSDPTTSTGSDPATATGSDPDAPDASLATNGTQNGSNDGTIDGTPDGGTTTTPSTQTETTGTPDGTTTNTTTPNGAIDVTTPAAAITIGGEPATETEVIPTTFVVPAGGAEELATLEPRSKQEYAAISQKQTAVDDLRAEVTKLRADAQFLKKKKDKEALLNAANRKEREADALEAEVTAMIDNVLLIETAEAAVLERSLNEPLQSDVIADEAIAYEEEAATLQSEADDLRAQAQAAGSKTERENLITQANEREELAQASNDKATQTKALAAKTNIAEQQILAKAAAASIDAEVPQINKTLAADEAQTVSQSPAYTDYVATKTDYRNDMAAFVEVAEAAEIKRKEAKDLDLRFQDLLAQANAATDPAAKQQLSADAETTRQQSETVAAEATQLEGEARTRRQQAADRKDAALKQLLGLQQDEYIDILALEGQNIKAGSLQYAAISPVPASFADGASPAGSAATDGTALADATSANPAGGVDPANPSGSTAGSEGTASEPVTNAGQGTETTDGTNPADTTANPVGSEPVASNPDGATDGTVDGTSGSTGTTGSDPAIADGGNPDGTSTSTGTNPATADGGNADGPEGTDPTTTGDPAVTNGTTNGTTTDPADPNAVATNNGSGNDPAANTTTPAADGSTSTDPAAPVDGSDPGTTDAIVVGNDSIPGDSTGAELAVNPGAATAGATTASTQNASSPEVAAAEEAFIELKSEPVVSARAQKERTSMEDELTTVEADATDMREQAILASSKKDKKVFEERAIQLEAQAEEIRASLAEVRLTAVTLTEAENAIVERPLDQPLESDLLVARAADAREEAIGLRADAQVLRETASGKKKEEAENLEKKADDLDRRADQLDKDAVTYETLTAQTRQAEKSAIRMAAINSMDAEVPLITKRLTPTEEQAVVENSAFSTYMANKSDYTKSSRKAEVLYVEAEKYQESGTEFNEDVRKLEFELGSHQRDTPEWVESKRQLDYVKQQQQFAFTTADSLRKQARVEEDKAILARAASMDALLSQDQDTYVNMLAYERRITEGTEIANITGAEGQPNSGDVNAQPADAVSGSEAEALASAGVVPAPNGGTDPTTSTQNPAGSDGGTTAAKTTGDPAGTGTETDPTAPSGTTGSDPLAATTTPSGADTTDPNTNPAAANTSGTDGADSGTTDPNAGAVTMNTNPAGTDPSGTDAGTTDPANPDGPGSDAVTINTTTDPVTPAGTEPGTDSGTNAGSDPLAANPSTTGSDTNAGTTPDATNAGGADAGSSAPTGGNPGSSNPTGTNPTTTSPTGTNPTTTDPLASNPTGTNPSGANPTGNPTTTNPASTNPAGTQPTGTPTGGTANVGTTSGSGPAGTVYEIPVQLNRPIYEPLARTESKYSVATPIPVDPPLPQGLIFKVQVGAFRNSIPQDLFRGFAPVHGESAGNGVTRYTAGLFDNIDIADNAKDQIRAIGYSDAFVVAFLNGQRIPLYEALAIIDGGTAGSTATTGTTAGGTPIAGTPTGGNPNDPIRVNSPTGTGRVDNIVPVGSNAGTTTGGTPGAAPPAATALPSAAADGNVTLTEVETIQGLFYTVQVGVYRQQVPPSTMYNITPLNSERTENGNVRYTSGIYNDVPTANTARDRIRNIGISDAFVTAYYNGTRISVAEARNLLSQQGTGILTATGRAPATTTPATTTPAATAPSANSAGVVYRVFLGRYAGQVPVSEAQTILSLGGQGVKVAKEGTQTVYECGEFSNFSGANALLQNTGGVLPQAAVVAYQNGTAIDVEAAKRLTNE